MMKKFDTPAPVSAVVNIPAGLVRFAAADRADTVVEVLPTDSGNSRDVKLAAQVTVEFGDGVLRVEAPAVNRMMGSSGSVEVSVQLPTGSRVEAKAASAELRTVGQLGEVIVDAQHASVNVEEAASGRLTLLAGDIQVGRLGGNAQISTGKGSIQVAEAAAGAVELRTEAGSITVSAAAGVSASLDASTGYGRISNGLASTGTADLTIRATTGHGDITARSL
jgi:DUF4097 and DUF4098 domain-containing protein YvlB